MLHQRDLVTRPAQKPKLLQPDCPVYLHAYVCTVTKQGLAACAQMRFINRGEKTVESLFLRVRGIDAQGNTSFEQNDITLVARAEPHSVFGEEHVFFLPRRFADALEITVERVLFEDGMIWRRMPLHQLLRADEAGWIDCECGMKNPPNAEACAFCAKPLKKEEPCAVEADAPEEAAEEVAEAAEETAEMTEEAPVEAAETTEETSVEATEESAETTEEASVEAAEAVEMAEEASVEAAEEAVETAEEASAEIAEEVAEASEEVTEEITEEAVEAVPVILPIPEPVAEESIESIAEEVPEAIAEKIAEPFAEELSEAVADDCVEAESVAEPASAVQDAPVEAPVAEAVVATPENSVYDLAQCEQIMSETATLLREIMARSAAARGEDLPTPEQAEEAAASEQPEPEAAPRKRRTLLIIFWVLFLLTLVAIGLLIYFNPNGMFDSLHSTISQLFNTEQPQ